MATQIEPGIAGYLRASAITHFINGAFVETPGGRTFETINPATNEPIARVAAGGAAEIDQAVAAARRAFDDGPWRRMPVKERVRALRRIADLIDQHTDDISYLETLDTGLALAQTRKTQVPRAADNFRFFAEMATKLYDGETFPVDGQFFNFSTRRPVGVAGLITPWNTPFMLETWKVAPCLAAGNTCVLKPSKWSPLSAHKLAEVMQEADLPPGVFNLVQGAGTDAGRPLVEHPDAQLISFTGSTETGQEIVGRGAATLKRCSMELGGKSPVIVFADADLDRALDAAIFGVFSLNGERCTAGSRLLLEDSIYDEFVAKLLARVARIKVGDPHDMTTEVGPLIHRDHLAKVRGYLDIARQEGARIAVGGDAPDDPALAHGNYLCPTVLLDVTNDMRVAQEEIFGPVLAVLRFRDEAEALRIANGTRYGLAAYLWTGDVTRAHRFAPEIESGMIWVNSQNVRHLPTPFGGMKWSGIGREGGHYSFEFYCETKNVCIAIGDTPIPRLGA
ncbi:MAG: 5-carboxymethyl-2-hydroxymuconate semialdehyde dehydrogenase [Thermomicrobiales bacterium]